MQPSSHILINEKPLQVHKFSDGALNVCIPDVVADNPIKISAVITSSDAIMELVLAVDALNAATSADKILVLRYMPYARHDRIFEKLQPLGLRAFARILNSLNFFSVICVDPHSNATEVLIENIRIIEQHRVFSAIEDLSCDFLVAPDAGAVEKAKKCAVAVNKPVICATKNRDVSTGKITNTKVDIEDLTDKHCMIVDDICDGGRTFIELAKVLREKGASRVDLYVTHGLFSQGFDVFKGYIDSIFYTNSLSLEPELTIMRNDIL